MSTKEAVSSSYANVVQPIGGPALPQKGLHENNKENQPAATSPTVSAGTQEKSSEEPSIKPAEDQPVADDSEFTPVIGNNKKDRKPRNDPPKAAAGTKERSDKPRRNRRERKGSRDKNKEKEKLEKQEEKSAESSDGQPEAAQKDKEVKFVEAPIPKVNAWKVSLFVKYQAIFICINSYIFRLRLLLQLLKTSSHKNRLRSECSSPNKSNLLMLLVR